MGLLKIQETQDLDAGDYACVAVNDAGRATGKITLDVGCKHRSCDRKIGFEIDLLLFHATKFEIIEKKYLSERQN